MSSLALNNPVYSTTAFKSSLHMIIKVYSEDKFHIICNHTAHPEVILSSAVETFVCISYADANNRDWNHIKYWETDIKAHLVDKENLYKQCDGQNL